MNCRIRNVALLLLVLVLATGLASAQGINNYSLPSADANGPVAKAPRAGNYWDGLASTDYAGNGQPANISSTPNPQIAVGPDDIVTVVNRRIARYPNPNALGNSPVTSPYNNPPTSSTFLDTWMGNSTASSSSGLPAVCPTTPRSNTTCVIDNASIRYDQMQGRFVVLFTATDVPAHISNFILIVSKYATFACSNGNHGLPPATTCSATFDMFTPPVTPIYGGPNIGGQNVDWFSYVIPINVVVPGTVTNGTKFCVPGSTPTSVWGGDPKSLPQTTVAPLYAAGPIVSGCTDYFPTGARFGLDNDNIILTAPVLDDSQPTDQSQPALINASGKPGGPYAGTRVVTVPKLAFYNIVALPADPTQIVAGTGLNNLADDTMTGTLTAITSVDPLFTTPAITTCLLGAGTFPNCTAAPTVSPYPNNASGKGTTTNPIPPIFWEPNNVRGRSLASFDAQVGPFGVCGAGCNTVAGVITPLDYLVGTRITDDLGAQNPLGSTTDNGNAVSSDTRFFVQPIVFYCSVSSLFPGPAGENFCGSTATVGTASVPVNETAVLGTLYNSGGASATTQMPRANANSLALTTDPALVRQGSPQKGLDLANDGTKVGRLFVGDSRIHQVIMREGLLYTARVARLYDSGVNNPGSNNALGTSTVIYDALLELGGQCATGAAGGAHPLATGTSPAAGIYCGTTNGNNPYSTDGRSIVNPYVAFETEWYNGVAVPDPTCTSPSNTSPCGLGFYSPMFDVPANVISSNTLNGIASLPTSPINFFPWLEKVFVGMTTGGTPNLASSFPAGPPSLWDFRPGDDAYDTIQPYIDPYTGATITNLPPMANGTADGMTPTTVTSLLGTNLLAFGFRGGESTDPNDGSLWMYGAFAKFRLAGNFGPGQWGTSLANYQLDFPTPDAYGNDNTLYADVPTSNAFFTWIQIAKNIGIAQSFTFSGTCPTGISTNPPIVPPPVGTGAPPGTGTTGSATQTCFAFGPDSLVSRSEMARWVVKAQMDEDQINTYLAATGGIPGCTTPVPPGPLTGSTTPAIGSTTGSISCVNSGSFLASSFGDAPIGCTSATNLTNCAYPGILNDPNLRYIETLYRRGYTKGCSATDDPIRRYCGNQIITRAQMSVFLIRAKMNNVFPTSLSGIPLNWPNQYGDNFSLFLPTTAYFTDEPTTDDYFIYIQKMREMRISNGKGSATTYAPNDQLTRKEIATFIVRAFFL